LGKGVMKRGGLSLKKEGAAAGMKGLGTGIGIG
jgi:hypothetical protein